MIKNALSLTILTAFGLLDLSQVSAEAFAPTPAEITILPPFCKAKLSPDPMDDKQFSATIGPDWLHIHHYCFALNFTNRYYRSYGDKAAHQDDLTQALGNYDYVLNHGSPNFWMRAEIRTQKGRLLAAAKRKAEAIGELEMALIENQNYAPAYVVLSDVYRDIGEKSKSLTAVELGLQHAPDNKSLQAQYKQLTGKTFVPPPLNAEEAAQKNQPPGTTTETPAAQAATPASAAPASEKPTPGTQPADAAGKIGSPTNPYCRFCTD